MVDNKAQSVLGGSKCYGIYNPKRKGIAMMSEAETTTRKDLPPTMRQWRADVALGAKAAYEIWQAWEKFNDGGQLERRTQPLQVADLLAVDADELEMFLNDLRDLQEQAEYAVEAMDAVIAAVNENDED